MSQNFPIGIQDFEKLIKEEGCYVDKTNFIKAWREAKDEVTLITRPRRFGKTLTGVVSFKWSRKDLKNLL